MEGEVRREFWIGLDRFRNLLAARESIAIAGGQRAGSAFILCGRKIESEVTQALACVLKDLAILIQ